MQDKYIVNEYIQGDPLHEENLDDVLRLINRIRLLMPEKTIWIYSGYTWIELFMYEKQIKQFPNFLRKDVMEFYKLRQNIIKRCNVLVDGRYIHSKRDITLAWRGSSNQNVIDIQQFLQKGEIILWTS